MRKPLIILSGPTAVGKTELSVSLAKEINGEIISADSMQIYKYMNIGSAKVTKEEMNHVEHYLIDELYPDEEFNVVRFQQMAKDAMDKIYEKGKIPIITGGTGFYIQAVLYDISFSESNDDDIRQELEKFAIKNGKRALHDELMKVDSEYAAEVHENNVKKVVRGLAFYKSTGTKLSEHNKKEHEKISPYDYLYFFLTMDRGKLYERIDMRVDQMIDNGLVSEVRDLLAKGYTKSMTSMQGLGYKEIIDYLSGSVTLAEAINIIKRDTRHFAKRQLTWFRREKNIIEIPKDDNALESMIAIVKEAYNYDTK